LSLRARVLSFLERSFQVVSALPLVAGAAVVRSFGLKNGTSLLEEPVYAVDDYEVMRGLEQDLLNNQWGDVEMADANAQGSLNRQRPIASNRATVLDNRASYARAYKKLCT